MRHRLDAHVVELLRNRPSDSQLQMLLWARCCRKGAQSQHPPPATLASVHRATRTLVRQQLEILATEIL